MGSSAEAVAVAVAVAAVCVSAGAISASTIVASFLVRYALCTLGTLGVAQVHYEVNVRMLRLCCCR